jgi:Tfp pilus assembly protein PilO
VLLIYIFYNHFYFPLNQKVTILIEKNKRLQQNLIPFQNENQGEVNAAHNRYQSDLAKLNLLLPCSPCIPEVIAFLEVTSFKSNAVLQGINYRNKTEDEANTSVDSLDFEVEAAGSYYDLITFLKNIKQAPRVYTFNYLKLIAVSKKQTSINEMDLTGVKALQGTEFKGWERFDGNNLLMTVNLTAYFSRDLSPQEDKINLDKVKPVQTGRDNPFKI